MFEAQLSERGVHATAPVQPRYALVVREFDIVDSTRPGELVARITTTPAIARLLVAALETDAVVKEGLRKPEEYVP